jgi:hypothetical protein
MTDFGNPEPVSEDEMKRVAVAIQDIWEIVRVHRLDTSTALGTFAAMVIIIAKASRVHGAPLTMDHTIEMFSDLIRLNWTHGEPLDVRN